MGSYVVKPATTVLPLSTGDTITVRTRLNHGEERRAYARMYSIDHETGRVIPNVALLADTAVCAYLLDWTLTDPDGHPLDIRGASLEDVQAALDTIDGAIVAEMREAIDLHQARTAAARDEEKKTRSGSNGGGLILPLPLRPGGPSHTSVS